ncbi:MAG: amino acid permease [Chlamydiales bacterium]|nr:amino acid permease [Chlamydiales bacterium]
MKNWKGAISGSLLIAGTTIGAGMLGIPLITGQAGLWPALLMTVVVWLYMLCTGLLFLEVMLWMPKGSNILSMAKRFMGVKGQWLAGGMFVFLYYCLMVAYFAAGAPLLSELFGLNLASWGSYLFFGAVFGIIVAIGTKTIDRANIALTVAMVIFFFLLVGVGSTAVVAERLVLTNWKPLLFAPPFLFSAFGYHNIIPPLTEYLKRDVKVLKLSIWLGTLIPLIFYVMWQWLIIGSIPQDVLQKTLEAGAPVTVALQNVTGNLTLKGIGAFFALFAIATSTIGVAFSLVDFLGDGFKVARKGLVRLGLCFLTFAPPLVFAAINPTIFDKALSVAGGFGEAFLNGFLPAALVWIGRYNMKLKGDPLLLGGKSFLLILLAGSIIAAVLEIFYLL